jgi:hypothetical protein
MPSQGYSTRTAQPSRRTRSRRTSQATTYVDPAYSYDEREALLDRTRQGLDNVQQTYIKPIWEYDPEQVWTRKSSPNIPPLEYFLAEARAKYNYGDPNHVNSVPEYWSVGGYEYGYPEGISPQYHAETRNPQLSYQSSGRSRRTDRSSTLVGTDSRRVSSTLVDSNRSSLNRSQRESRAQRDSRSSRRMSVPVVEPTRTTSNRAQRTTRTANRPTRTSRPRAQTPHPRANRAYTRIPEPVQSVSANLVQDEASAFRIVSSLHNESDGENVPSLILDSSEEDFNYPSPATPITPLGDHEGLTPSFPHPINKAMEQVHKRKVSHGTNMRSDLGHCSESQDQSRQAQVPSSTPIPHIIPELAYLAELPLPFSFPPPKTPPAHPLPLPPLVNHVPCTQNMLSRPKVKITITPSGFVTHSSYDLRPHNLVVEEQELRLQKSSELLFAGLSFAGVGSRWSPESSLEDWDGRSVKGGGGGGCFRSEKNGRVKRAVDKMEGKGNSGNGKSLGVRKSLRRILERR